MQGAGLAKREWLTDPHDRPVHAGAGRAGEFVELSVPDTKQAQRWQLSRCGRLARVVSLSVLGDSDAPEAALGLAGCSARRLLDGCTLRLAQPARPEAFGRGVRPDYVTSNIVRDRAARGADRLEFDAEPNDRRIPRGNSGRRNDGSKLAADRVCDPNRCVPAPQSVGDRLVKPASKKKQRRRFRCQEPPAVCLGFRLDFRPGSRHCRSRGPRRARASWRRRLRARLRAQACLL
jgi:hypothetical protein